MYVTITERKYIQVVEVDPQVFEVANLEESDAVFEDAEVDVCDVTVLDYDDVRITELRATLPKILITNVHPERDL